MSESETQIALLEYLDKIEKSNEIIQINEALTGVVDLSVFTKDNGFSNLKELIFLPGQITSVINIPPILEKLTISNQNITALPPLTDTLTFLDVANNQLTYVDLKGASNLKQFICNNNKISTFENLPKSLEDLNIENNQIKLLDLKNVQNMQRLYCSNNPMLVIYNKPESIVDFQCENSPLVELSANIKNTEKAKTVAQTKISLLESVETFFKLKHDYELKLHKTKKDFINNSKSKGMSAKGSIQRAKNIKIKCIYCDRPVGTVFSLSNDRYGAVCGDQTNPCPLKIEIYRGSVSDLNYLITLFKEEVDRLKENIIIQKMDTLFSYINEDQSVKLFTELMKEYASSSDIYAGYLSEYNALTDNEIKKKVIEEKKKKINSYITDIQLKLQDYKKTENIGILKAAMEIYTRDLIPEINILQQKKYAIMEMDNYSLFQNGYHMRDLEIFTNEPSVINFVVK